MNTAILDLHVQEYLDAQADMHAAGLAFKKSPFAGISAGELAQQVDSRQRCRKKLPLWYKSPGIFYPPRIAIEQASSEITAAYKGRLIDSGSRVIDLTGGFGVDAFYIARRAKVLVYCEQNGTLAEIVKHNLSAMGVENVTVKAMDGLQYLQGEPNDAFDCIYLDPSRRKDTRRVFLLNDCEPNIIACQDLLLQKAKYIIVKTAPLLDISSTLQALRDVRSVHVLSVDNECKELLFVLERGFEGKTQIIAAALSEKSVRNFRFSVEDEKSAVPTFGLPETYLYEPDAALLKAGGFRVIGERYGMRKLHINTHLYTDQYLRADFIGRSFYIDKIMTYADFKKLKTPLQANISTRNFPLDPATLAKKHRIADGGSTYIFFCTGPGKELLVIFTSKCDG